MVWEAPIHIGIDHHVMPRQARGQRLYNRPGRAIARIPHHFQRAVPAIPILQYAVSIACRDIHGAIRTSGFGHHITISGHAANLLNLRAVEGLLADHHLEAVIIGRVMATGHHRRAIGFERIGREIEHRCRAQPNPHHFKPAGAQARYKLRFHLGRMQPAIIAHCYTLAPTTADDAAKAAANGIGIFRVQGFADNAPNIIFAQHGGVEAMIESGHGKGSQGRPIEE